MKTLEEIWDELDFSYEGGTMVTSMRIDKDIVAFFKKNGPGYQTRMRQVLKAYVAYKKQKKGKK